MSNKDRDLPPFYPSKPMPSRWGDRIDPNMSQNDDASCQIDKDERPRYDSTLELQTGGKTNQGQENEEGQIAERQRIGQEKESAEKSNAEKRNAEDYIPKPQPWESWEGPHARKNKAVRYDDDYQPPLENNPIQESIRGRHSIPDGSARQSNPNSTNSIVRWSNQSPNNLSSPYNIPSHLIYGEYGSTASSTGQPRSNSNFYRPRLPTDYNKQRYNQQRDSQKSHNQSQAPQCNMNNHSPHRSFQNCFQSQDQSNKGEHINNRYEEVTLPRNALPNINESVSVARTSATFPANHESRNDDNIYSTLDEEEDDGRKRISLKPRITSKETVINLAEEDTDPCKSVSEKNSTISGHGKNASGSKTLSESDKTPMMSSQGVSSQEESDPLPPPPAPKRKHLKKTSKRKMGKMSGLIRSERKASKSSISSVRRSQRKGSSMSDEAVEQTAVTLDEKETEKEALEQDLPQSRELECQTPVQRPVVSPSISNKAPVKRRLRVIITLKISKSKVIENESEDSEHSSEGPVWESGRLYGSGGSKIIVEETKMIKYMPGDDRFFTINEVQYWHQTLPCKDIPVYRSLPKCRTCTVGKDDHCLFQNIRALPLTKSGKLPANCAWDKCFFRPLQVSLEEAQLPNQEDLNHSMDHDTRMHMQYVCAKSLLLIFKGALQHSLAEQIIVRPREIQFRHYCDFCNTGLFVSSHLCRKCGQEYCPACYRKMLEEQDHLGNDEQNGIYRCASDLQANTRYLHNTTDMLPVTRFTSEELDIEIKAMQEIVQAIQPTEMPQITANDDNNNSLDLSTESDLSDTSESERESSPTDSEIISEPQSGTSEGFSEDCRIQKMLQSHPIARFQKNSMNEEEFVKVWKYGIPLVVSDVSPRLTWDPNAFQERYGKMMCTVVRSDEEWNSKMDKNDAHRYCKKLTVHDFFETFSMDADQRRDFLGEGNWKLKDWPPAADLQTSFPDLYEDFNAFVPMPDHTRRDGCKNLSSLFAKNANTSDLGPKMYNAWPGDHKAGGKGTTRLHMDIADAVNVLLYASDDLRIVDGHAAAQWDIFRAEDSDKIRKFLRKHCAADEEDPIHSQKFFLDDHLLQKLYAEKGVYSWRILQRAGEAIFIPAGCAHQVCNLTDCIKIAVDFLSPYNIERCFKLTEEFRKVAGENVKSWKEDVLQLHTQLWYAWCTCKRLAGTEQIRDDDEESSL